MVRFEISITDILEYLGDRVRPLKEGEAVFKAGHIILCGVEREQPQVVKSLCLQTSALVQPPHEISVLLNGQNWQCRCTCKAGLSGFCKHVVATLIYINRNEDLEVISCTEVQQKWGKEKKDVQDMYKAKPFSEFCHPTIKRKYNFVTAPSIDKINFNLLVSGTGDSALSRFIQRAADTTGEPAGKKIRSSISRSVDKDIETFLDLIEESHFLNNLQLEGFSNLAPCCQSILKRLGEVDRLKIACFTTQGSDEWKKERQLRITGSTCYSIFTYGTTGNSNWEQKALSFFFPKGFTNKFVEHGRYYEEEARNLFQINTNVKILTPSLIVSKRMPWLAFSPDGIVYKDGVPNGLLEIKCPYIGKEKGSDHFLDYCDYLEEKNGQIVLKTRHKYYGQIQLGMALMNLRTTFFVIYSPFSKSYLEVIVKFDETFAENLIRIVTKIFSKYVTSLLFKQSSISIKFHRDMMFKN